jgi:preprotein translocase subunit SecD
VIRLSLRRLVALLLVLGMVSCSRPPQPTAATRTMTVSLPVPVADKAVVDAAGEVFSKRLKALGITNFTITVGDAMEFTLQVPLTFDGQLVDAVLKRPGVFEFVSWPAHEPHPSAEGPVPTAATPLFDGAAEIKSADVVTVTSGTPALNIKLSAAGSEAIASFTTLHIGEYLVLALDGKVLAAPIVSSPITGGDLRMTFPTTEPPAIPLAALAAMMTSGPLPDAWTAQP